MTAPLNLALFRRIKYAGVMFFKRKLHGTNHYKQALGLGANIKKKKRREHHFYEKIHPWKTEEEFLDEIIGSNVIYQDDHIVAINKPNKIAMAGSLYDDLPVEVRPQSIPNYTIQAILNRLQEYFEASYFREVYSQPRVYSGPVVFAKTEKSFNLLKKYFRHGRANKVLYQKYLAVCVGEPVVTKQLLEFPMQRIKCGEHSLTMKCLTPSNRARKRREVAVSVIEHNVLDKKVLGKGGQINVTLVELSLSLTKWNAIEAYMVDNCLCPVLGDHVYSSRLVTLQGKTVRLSPKQSFPDTQVLPYEITTALEYPSVNQIHHTPLHVHCHELTIPVLSENMRIQEKTVTAPVPDFFSKTLDLLGLSLER